MNLPLAIPGAGDWEGVEQAMAAIQTWANRVGGIGVWVDVPYAATLFTTNSTGSVTPFANPYLYQYTVVGTRLELQVCAKLTINNGTTTEIRVALPAGFTARPYDDPGGDNRAAGWAIFNDGTNAGAAGAFVNASKNCISVQRWDGTAAAGFLNASSTFIRFTVPVRILSPVG